MQDAKVGDTYLFKSIDHNYIGRVKIVNVNGDDVKLELLEGEKSKGQIIHIKKSENIIKYNSFKAGGKRRSRKTKKAKRTRKHKTYHRRR